MDNRTWEHEVGFKLKITCDVWTIERRRDEGTKGSVVSTDGGNPRHSPIRSRAGEGVQLQPIRTYRIWYSDWGKQPRSYRILSDFPCAPCHLARSASASARLARPGCSQSWLSRGLSRAPDHFPARVAMSFVTESVEALAKDDRHQSLDEPVVGSLTEDTSGENLLYDAQVTVTLSDATDRYF